jgi:hypothetical protein
MIDWAWRRGLLLAACVMVRQERADGILNLQISVVRTPVSVLRLSRCFHVYQVYTSILWSERHGTMNTSRTIGSFLVSNYCFAYNSSNTILTSETPPSKSNIHFSIDLPGHAVQSDVAFFLKRTASKPLCESHALLDLGNRQRRVQALGTCP